MPNRSIIPGVIIIVIGALILLNNLNILAINWDFFWRLWPLLLIVAGLVVLASRRSTAWVALLVLLLLLAGLAVAGQYSHWDFIKNLPAANQPVTQSFTQDYSSDISARAKFRLEAGAGTFAINGSTDQLINVDTESSQGSYTLDRTEDNGVTSLLLKQSNTTSFSFGRVKNTATVHLNENPIWEIDLKTGAAKLDADLSNYKIDTLTLDAGASSVTIKLGDKQDEMHGTLSTGAASLELQVPKGVGCEITTDTGLSSQDINGFIKDGSVYRTEGFDGSGKKIYLTLKSGVSSIKVSRY